MFTYNFTNTLYYLYYSYGDSKQNISKVTSQNKYCSKIIGFQRPIPVRSRKTSGIHRFEETRGRLSYAFTYSDLQNTNLTNPQLFMSSWLNEDSFRSIDVSAPGITSLLSVNLRITEM